MRSKEQSAKTCALQHYPITESQIEPVTKELLWSAWLDENFTLKDRTLTSRSRRIYSPQLKMRKRPGEKNVSIWTTNSQINNLQSSDQDKETNWIWLLFERQIHVKHVTNVSFWWPSFNENFTLKGLTLSVTSASVKRHISKWRESPRQQEENIKLGC